jgi:hypothetical protein
MVRVGTIAAAVGVLTGLLNVVEYLQACRGVTSLCPALSTAPPGLDGTITLGLAVLLILNSLACFIGPRRIFYGITVLGLAIDLVVGVNSSAIAPGSLYLTLGLATLAAVLGVMAARQRTGVSEQSHPMNLPVFG